MLLLLALASCATQKEIKLDTAKPYPYSDTGDKDTGTPVIPDECDGLPLTAGDGSQVCLLFEQVAGSRGLSSYQDHMGLSIADTNGDGEDDLYLQNYNTTNQLFLNDQGQFSDGSVGANLSISAKSYDAVFADYDNDGDQDLLLTGEEGSALYQNSSGIFSLVASPNGIHDINQGRTAAWLESGFLIATNNGTKFYENTGGDAFTQSTESIGLSDYGDGSAIVSADFNGDGRQDVYLANTTGANRLFYQQNDGTYDSVEDSVGLNEIGNQQSTDAKAVLFGGGRLPSLYVSSWEGGNLFYINQGDGTFVDQAAELGVHDAGATTCVAWGDLGLNLGQALFLGRWDEENLFYVPTFNSDGDIERYVEVQTELGMDETEETLDAEWFDYDSDGDNDLVVVTYDGSIWLYENQSFAM